MSLSTTAFMSTKSTFVQYISTSSCQESWQAKHAALAAVKQTVEYVEEGFLGWVESESG